VTSPWPDKIALQQQMQRHGVRHLLVISGEADWCAEQAADFIDGQPGDWTWVSDTPPLWVADALPFSAAHTLLGQERLHGVFDARQGLNVEALAAFAGILQAGSWLVLLVPEWQQWAQRQDADSLRWSEQPQPIATPNFIQRFQSLILQDAACTLHRQHQPCQLTVLPEAADWTPPDGQPTPEQQRVLQQLNAAQSGIYVLTAPRGRGKSTLAGMLVADWPGECWVTAPAKSAADRLAEQSAGKVRFWSPDALLAQLEQHPAAGVDWLLIDEAAAIPTPQLSRLIAAFPRILLTTTVQGYEGTGRGFILKFCASLPQWHDLRLDAPIRWSKADPLEPFLNQLLLFNDAPAEVPVEVLPSEQSLQLTAIQCGEWLSEPGLLADFYGLLTSAHYRTSPLDLRRLMDAPGLSFAAAMAGDRVAGAIWLVEEGGLSPTLAHEVWAGRRRPRGNLVAQSLAAHGGQIDAAVLRSRRVSRIAVQPGARRQGIARALLAQQAEMAANEGLDFLSVSFGYTADLSALWQQAGYRLLRVGSQLEASSGCYAAMAALPISDAGWRMVEQVEQQLARDWPWLRQLIALELDVELDQSQALSEADWRELAGFAFAHRAVESSYAALQRLLLASELPLAALRAHLQQKLPVAECVERLSLSGRKALLQRWRHEAAQALTQLDAARCATWRSFAKPKNGGGE
jgi:tRNA(Met) cytidine acetyltransferase